MRLPPSYLFAPLNFSVFAIYVLPTTPLTSENTAVPHLPLPRSGPTDFPSISLSTEINNNNNNNNNHNNNHAPLHPRLLGIPSLTYVDLAVVAIALPSAYRGARKLLHHIFSLIVEKLSSAFGAQHFDALH
ncbi:MAG: hypothetical protein Q9168_008401, partial [Polycauliona sp. 1 TL-2023]